MKFMHIADVHLGATPDAGKAYSKYRAKELWDTFTNAIEMCEKSKIEVLLIAGDLFHRQPLLRELKEVNYLFSRLTKTKVVFIAGNHDYIKKDSYYRTFIWNENVFPIFSEDMSKIEFDDLDLEIYGFSYYSQEIRESKYNLIKPQNKQRHTILLLHGGDELHVPIQKEELLKLNYDYVALGHIHKPQIIVKDKIAFSGALEPLQKNDLGEHGFILGKIEEMETKLKFVNIAKRKYLHKDVLVSKGMTNGELKQCLQQEIEADGVENLYKITLKGFKDPDIYFDTHSFDSFGNILEILDETNPAIDLEKIFEQNKDNLLGKYIQNLKGSLPDSVEYQALYEGVLALLETKRE